MAKKIYVLDTSACLTNASVIYKYGNNDIAVPLKVFDEIDKHKHRQDGVGANARKFIRDLDDFREKGDIHKGVRIAKGKGLIYAAEYDPGLMPNSLDPEIADNKIITTALTIKKKQEENNTRRKVILISCDINMRIKGDAIGMPTENFWPEQVVEHQDQLYNGFKKYLVDDQLIDQFYDGEEIFLEEEEIYLYPNQFVMLLSSSNDKKSALCRFLDYNTPLQKVPECNGGKKDLWGIRPRNKEQGFAMNLLLDPNIPIVTLTGRAGTGKTLCAIAAGLAQVIDQPNSVYKHLIVSRPIQPMGKDIGFLPGSLEDKMMPWLSPVKDNLKYLLGNNQETLNMYISQGIIEIEALTYIRGRSISGAYIIIDEAQNLSIHEMKTIITRVGENTKIVLTGDIEQIDNIYVDETTNGLTCAIEKFKEHALSGHVSLTKGERSKVATLAAKIL